MPSSVSVVIFQSPAVHRQPVLSTRSVQCEPSLSGRGMRHATGVTSQLRHPLRPEQLNREF